MGTSSAATKSLTDAAPDTSNDPVATLMLGNRVSLVRAMDREMVRDRDLQGRIQRGERPNSSCLFRRLLRRLVSVVVQGLSLGAARVTLRI